MSISENDNLEGVQSADPILFSIFWTIAGLPERVRGTTT